jgi:Zn-finger nucleic acid-binding protein
MAAVTLNCPTCGASISSDEMSCRYCGSRLATIACPKCFGMMFVGSKFCPHCGEAAEQPIPVGPVLPCPDCKVKMTQLLLRRTHFQECEKCHGIWVDQVSFDRICASSDRQADILGDPRLATKKRPPPVVRYRPCPDCGQLMNRYNFAHTSGVVIDVCAAHGVWFDRDELQSIIDFIRAGGMSGVGRRAREREAHAQDRVDQLARSYGLDRDDEKLGIIMSVIGVLGTRIWRP